jgi:mRNA interferase RelE/StbE
MSYSVEFTPGAINNLGLLTSANQQRTLNKIRWLSENFENISPQALSANLTGLFKLRVGDYRVIYSFDLESQQITIHKIGHRREVYS